MEEGVSARPQRKIKLTEKAISLAENHNAGFDSLSDASEDDSKEAESDLLESGRHLTKESAAKVSRRRKAKDQLTEPNNKVVDFDLNLVYQHLEDETISSSEEEDVRVSDSESDSDEAEGESSDE